MKSRPDRQPDVIERRARGEEARRARDAYTSTPPFTLVCDEYATVHDVDSASAIPLLKPKPSPRTNTVNRYWFNPSWIGENERPDVDHGEFQSPVWLAVHMTMQSDRDREVLESPRRPRHAATESDPGQLRSLLALVSGATLARTSPLTNVTYVHPGTTGDRPSASSRYHDLPQRSGRPVRRFARFLSSNFSRVSVNHN